MFARILEFGLKPEKKVEFIKALKHEVLPILKKQTGFLELLPFFPEKVEETVAVNISFWTTKADAEWYQKETYPKVLEILKPYLITPINTRVFELETTVCKNFVEALAV
jgi:quinol monooxygenase YgiN